MKKITAAILLSLFTVSLFAQGAYPGDGMEIYGKNNSTNTVNKPLGYYTDKSYTGGFGIITTFGKDELGIMASVSPKKLKGFGFYSEIKLGPSSSDYEIIDLYKNVGFINEYYTWQTDYGSYTKVTENLNRSHTISSSSISRVLNLGVIIPTKSKLLRFYAGAGINRRIDERETEITYRVYCSEHTHYQLAGGDFYDGWFRESDVPDVLTIEKKQTQTANISGGIIFGNVFAATIGFDSNIAPNLPMRTVLTFGLGIDIH
jgi:hypothetical protein